MSPNVTEEGTEMLTQRLIVVSSDSHQLAALKAELGRGFDTAESLATLHDAVTRDSRVGSPA